MAGGCRHTAGRTRTSLQLGSEGINGVLPVGNCLLENIGTLVDAAKLETEPIRGAGSEELLDFCD